MKGYWIGRVDVENPTPIRICECERPAFAKFGGRFLCAAVRYRAVEGASARNIVIEFPSYEAALACWDSPEYQAVKTKRDGHATAEIIVIEGYEG